MTLFKHVPVLATLLLAIASIHAYAGEDEAMAHRDQALRQQHSRVQELMLKQGTASVSAPSANGAVSRSLSMQHGVSSAAVTQSANGVGVIKLSDKPTTNQQLRQGMNTARTSLKGMKAAQQNVTEQEQQRSQAEAALEQAVQAYLASRTEAKVPIRSHYEHDAFLREMITIKQALAQKALDASAINSMLDHLAVARTILVTLTESTQ